MNKLLGKISIGKKLMLIGVVFAATLIGIVVYTVVMLNAQKDDSSVINIAGRERMLTQKFTKEVLQELAAGKSEHAASDKTGKLFEVSLQAIRQGGDTYSDLDMTKVVSLPANINRAIEQQLATVATDWGKLTDAVEAMRAAKPGSAELSKQAEQVEELNVTTLKNMHKAIGLLAAQTDGKISAMERVEWMILLLALIASGLLLFFIARAIIKPLNEAIVVSESIANGNLKNSIDNDQHDEIGILLASLQRMQTNLSSFLQGELAPMLQATQRGDFSKTIETEGKQGVYAAVSKISNDVVAELEQSFEDLDAAFSAMQQGDLNFRITREYEGVLNRCKQSSNQSMQQIDNILNQELAGVWIAVGQGDLSKRVDMAGKQGFYKDLGVATNNVSETLEQAFDDIEDAFDALQEGRVTHRITAQYEGIFDRCKQASNKTCEQLTNVLGNVNTVAVEVETGSAEIAEGNNTLSNRTQEQAAALEETAASIEEITGTVQQTADNSRQANQLAVDAREQAESGGKVAEQAVKAMTEINASSHKISDIIGVIDEIAFQTNLLALNAAVEAARAGEQGRGFAVVAGEVRTLAQRSAEAAKEIKGLINSSVESVSAGSKLVDETGEALHAIVGGVRKVGDIIAEIAAAGVEQTAGIDQINKAISQLDSGTQQNTAMVEESAAASERLNDQALELRRLVSVFDLGQDTTATAPKATRSTSRRSTGSRPKATPSKKSSKQSKSTTPDFPKAGTVEDDDVWEEF